jgi:hypothetical protein
MEAAMANLTLSIPDPNPDPARARKVAAERGTTVNAMVREFIAKQVNTITPEQQEAIHWMTARSEAYAGRCSGPLPTREETYDRRISGPL